MIEVLTSGAANSVQDLGRKNFLRMAVGRGGAMDRLAFEIGNALLGNPADSAGIEVAYFPFRLRFHAETAFAVSGAECGAKLDEEALPPCWTRTARAGQVLALGAPRRGARAYVTLAGGIDVPLVLGSRATDAKSGFGGFCGRGLTRGDFLSLAPSPGSTRIAAAGFGAAPPTMVQHAGRPAAEILTVRVLPAAEYASFTDAALQTFAESSWAVSADANRTGYRLEGPDLPMRNRTELLSYGVMPGLVQVPPSGQPIVQLADANTMGGYPKIATVIEADLWKLAQHRVGERVGFFLVSRDAAIAALRAMRAEIESVRDAACWSLDPANAAAATKSRSA